MSEGAELNEIGWVNEVQQVDHEWRKVADLLYADIKQQIEAEQWTPEKEIYELLFQNARIQRKYTWDGVTFNKEWLASISILADFVVEVEGKEHIVSVEKLTGKIRDAAGKITRANTSYTVSFPKSVPETARESIYQYLTTNADRYIPKEDRFMPKGEATAKAKPLERYPVGTVHHIPRS